MPALRTLCCSFAAATEAADVVGALVERGRRWRRLLAGGESSRLAASSSPSSSAGSAKRRSTALGAAAPAALLLLMPAVDVCRLTLLRLPLLPVCVARLYVPAVRAAPRAGKLTYSSTAADAMTLLGSPARLLRALPARVLLLRRLAPGSDREVTSSLASSCSTTTAERRCGYTSLCTK